MHDRSNGPLLRPVLAAVLCTVLAAPVVAADGDDYAGVDPVIPPGEEAVIASMLGRGQSLPHYCTLIRGGVDHTVIKATYNCLGNEVTLQLAHPRNATAASTRTGQFAITVESGSAPPDFQDALATLVRSQERYFQWAWAESTADAGDDAAE